MEIELKNWYIKRCKFNMLDLLEQQIKQISIHCGLACGYVEKIIDVTLQRSKGKTRVLVSLIFVCSIALFF